MGKGSTRHLPVLTEEAILAKAAHIARERGFTAFAQELDRVAHQSREGDSSKPADESGSEDQGSEADTE